MASQVITFDEPMVIEARVPAAPVMSFAPMDVWGRTTSSKIKVALLGVGAFGLAWLLLSGSKSGRSRKRS